MLAMRTRDEVAAHVRSLPLRPDSARLEVARRRDVEDFAVPKIARALLAECDRVALRTDRGGVAVHLVKERVAYRLRG